MIADLGIAFGRVAFVMFFVLNVAAILGWVERKQSAIMQDRIGANRASIFGIRAMGLFHPLADTLSEADLKTFLDTNKLVIEREVAAMPPYDAFLNSLSPAGVAA